MSNAAKLQQYWEKSYESTTTPFDSDLPDEWIAGLEKDHKIKGDILDAGCGPGRTSLYLTGRGYNVIGVDISSNAIGRAKRKAAEQGRAAQFQQANIFELTGYDDRFDTVIDIGCFHSLYDDRDRAAYATSLYRACRSGAVIYLRAFSTNNQKDESWIEHSPDLREDQIRVPFSNNGWTVKELEERQIDLWISDEMTLQVRCWFAAIHRS